MRRNDFKPGEKVRIKEGRFAGTVGEVRGHNGSIRMLWVCFSPEERIREIGHELSDGEICVYMHYACFERVTD